jgi:hypothetical protein
MDNVFSFLSAALAVFATIPLCLGVIYKGQRPSRMTWMIWTLLTLIVGAGMLDAGTLTAQMVLIIICDFIIVGFSLWRGTGGWTLVDKLTLAACIVIVCLWRWSGDPLVAIVFSLAATCVASTPMLLNIYKDPTIEKPLPYGLMLASTIAQLIALLFSPGPLVIEGWLQPVVYMSVQIIILWLLLRGWFSRKLRLPA